MEELDALLGLGPEACDVWSEFKVSDTDEEWSVSESSSDCGAFGMDELVPESGVQAALCQLELLASNTTSALSLPRPYDRDGQLGELSSGRRGGASRDEAWPALATFRQPCPAPAPAEGLAEAPAAGRKTKTISPRHALLQGHESAALLCSSAKRELTCASPPLSPSSSGSGGSSGSDGSRRGGARGQPQAQAQAQQPQQQQQNKKRKVLGKSASDSSLSARSTSLSTVSSASTATAASVKLERAEALAASADAGDGSDTDDLEHDFDEAGGKRAGKRCEFCLEKFDSSDNLAAHRQHHIVSAGHFRCTFADCAKKNYATGEGLRLHVRNVHLCAKNWKCLAQECSRSFVRQSDLRMHIIRMHSQIRPYPCLVQVCNKSFACHSELRRHVHSCHKLPCPKPDKCEAPVTKSDASFIQGLMLKETEC
jgi:hypothetical protein